MPKQAIRLGVSSYLLKPIADEELKDALEGCMNDLEKERKSRKFMDLMKEQIRQNRNYLRDIFFNDWIDGKLSDGEWQEQMEFLGIKIPDYPSSHGNLPSARLRRAAERKHCHGRTL